MILTALKSAARKHWCRQFAWENARVQHHETNCFLPFTAFAYFAEPADSCLLAPDEGVVLGKRRYFQLQLVAVL
ncbi:MAG: hypothetical protein ACAH88_13175, partial [Roseimicrobium sp.]